MNVDGILNVNKPSGMTSFAVISLLRKLSGQKRIGHTGTLDPFATGVLPVCFGRAVRISRFLADTNKCYLAQIELGISTDTYDIDGQIIEQKPTNDITVDLIKQALSSFLGIIKQTPPIYSAVKYRGKKLYQLARSGIDIKPQAREVTIYKIGLIEYNHPYLTLDIECSKGTYIRSIAHELGQKLGCGAYLKALTRTKSGIFIIEDASNISAIEKAFQKGTWQSLLYPIDYPLSGWKRIILSPTQETAIKNGSSIVLAEIKEDGRDCVLAYGSDDTLLAILKYDVTNQLWKHEVLFTSEER